MSKADRSFVKNAVYALAQTGFTGIVQRWVEKLADYKYESVWNALRVLESENKVKAVRLGPSIKIYGDGTHEAGYEGREIVVKIDADGKLSAKWKSQSSSR